MRHVSVGRLSVQAVEEDKGVLLCRYVFGCDGMESAVAHVGKKESRNVHTTTRSEVSRLFGRVRVANHQTPNKYC